MDRIKLPQHSLHFADKPFMRVISPFLTTPALLAPDCEIGDPAVIAAGEAVSDVEDDVYDDEVEIYSRLLSGQLALGDISSKIDSAELITEEMRQYQDYARRGREFDVSALPQMTAHRDTGEAVPYYPGPCASISQLRPSPIQCQLDALAVAQYFWKKHAMTADVLCIRSRGPKLEHFFSVWRADGLDAQRYDGIHYAGIHKGTVFDLQSRLPPLLLKNYLDFSFGRQEISVGMTHPSRFAETLRTNRHFRLRAHTYPELKRDQLPPYRVITKSLHEILREKRAGRPVADAEKSVGPGTIIFPDIFPGGFPYR